MNMYCEINLDSFEDLQDQKKTVNNQKQRLSKKDRKDFKGAFDCFKKLQKKKEKYDLIFS